MDVPSPESHFESPTDKYPLLMEASENRNDPEHIINISRNSNNTSSSSSDGDSGNEPEHSRTDYMPSISTVPPISQPSMSSSNVPANARNSSLVRRGEGYTRRRRSPLNSGIWISIELAVTFSQIIASIVVLSISGDENPQTPLFTWIVGYAAGCFTTLPLLFWRFKHRNSQIAAQEATQGSSQGNPTSDPTPYRSVSNTHSLEEGTHRPAVTTTQNAHNANLLNARIGVLVDHLKMSLDCYFAVWFVVGNVWIFGGHSSAADAPNMYRLCIVFLTFSCIGYAMPFILCATICCCLPCIISILGFREDLTHTRGATPESISALPTYKFKLKKDGIDDGREINLEGTAGEDGGGGVIGSGTGKERTISGEDAACCICLAKYADNDELRELPCAHFFHMECVDKWLKINALCPLCKSEVGETTEPLQSTTASS